MIPEYRQRALRRGNGLHWAMRLRLLLIVPGSHPWNRWVRSWTAAAERGETDREMARAALRAVKASDIPQAEEEK